jgi:hypothetical protein
VSRLNESTIGEKSEIACPLGESRIKLGCWLLEFPLATVPLEPADPLEVGAACVGDRRIADVAGALRT